MHFALCYDYKPVGARGVECGGLNRFGPHRLMCLNAWPTGSGTIRRCVLVGVGVSLALKFQMLQLGPVSFILPAACQSGCRTLTTSPAPVPVFQHASHHDENGLTL